MTFPVKRGESLSAPHAILHLLASRHHWLPSLCHLHSALSSLRTNNNKSIWKQGPRVVCILPQCQERPLGGTLSPFYSSVLPMALNGPYQLCLDPVVGC